MSKNHTQELLEFIKNDVLKQEHPTFNEKTDLFTEHILNSMNILDLIGFVERSMGRRLKDTEIEMKRFQNVETIIKSFFS